MSWWNNLDERIQYNRGIKIPYDNVDVLPRYITRFIKHIEDLL